MRPSVRFKPDAVCCPASLFLIVFLATLMLTALPQSSLAKKYTYIDIKNPFSEKTPVAVTEFMLATGSPPEAADARQGLQILKESLNFTGYLKVMNPAAFLSSPAEKGVSLPEIKFKDWTGIGADLLVTGKIQQRPNGEVSVALRLFDTFKSELVVGNIYSGKRSQVRQIILQFCADVSKALTGSTGVFNSKIAFVSKRGRTKEIFTCDFDGKNIKPFTRHNSISLAPSWSHDGQWLAYVSYAKGGTKILIRQVQGKLGAIVNYPGTNSAPDWMPGSLKLAAAMTYQGDPEIYLLTRKGEMIKRITRSSGIDVSPDFSPDGRKIAFTSRRYGSPQIYIKDLETGQVKRLTYQGNHNTSPAWSPDGKRIAYVGIEDNSIDIFVIRVDSGMPVQLTMDSGDNEDPSWSPDGSMLAFTSTRNGRVPKIFVMNASGTDQRQLIVKRGRQSQPAWSPSLNTDE